MLPAPQVWDKDRFTSDDLVGKFSCKMDELVDFDTGTILKNDIVCTVRGADGKPVVCELGLLALNLVAEYLIIAEKGERA